jgi:hypothetical protein
MRARWLRMIPFVPLFIVGAVAVFLVWIDSDGGRDFLRTNLLSIVNEQVLDGHLEIASIDGSLFSDLHVRGVALDDKEGQRALEIEDLHLAYDLRALIHGRVRVNAFEIVRPMVRATMSGSGELNFNTLLKPSQKEPEEEEEKKPDEPSETQIEVARFAIVAGSFALSGPSRPPLAISELGLTVSATIAGPVIETELSFLHAAISEPALEIDGRAHAKIDPKTVSARVDLSSSDAKVELHDFELRLPDRAKGRLHVVVPKELVRVLAGDAALGTDLRLDAIISEGTESERPWHVDLEGDLSGAKIRGAADAGAGGGGGKITFGALDPHALHEKAPAGSLDLEITADQREPGHAVARIAIGGELDVLGDPVQIRSILARARLDESLVDLDTHVDLASNAGTLLLDAGAEVEIGSKPNVRSSSVTIEARELGSLLPKTVPLSGSIDLEARAQGAVDDLSASALVKGSSLAIAGVRIAGLSLDASLSDLPAKPSGSTTLSVRKLSTPEISFDQVHAKVGLAKGRRAEIALDAEGKSFLRGLALNATVALGKEVIDLDIAHLVADTSSATWEMKGAKVAVDTNGPITIRGVALESKAGSIRAEGKIDPKRLADAPGEIKLAIQQFDLASLTGLAPPLRGLSGKVDLSAEVITGNRAIAVNVSLGARDLKRRGAGPLDLDLKVGLDEGAITASVAAGGSELGAVKLAAKGRIPRNPLEPGIAKKSELVEVNAEIAQLDLARLLAFTGTTSPIAGRVDGKLAVGRRFSTADVDLALRELALPGVALPLDMDIALDLRPNDVHGEISGVMRGAPLMRVLIDSTAGTEAILRSGIAAFEERGAALHLGVENVPAELIALLARLDPADPRFSEPRGRASLVLDAKGAVKDVVVTLTVSTDRFALAKGAPELEVDLFTRLAGGKLDATLGALLGRRGAASLELSAAVPSLENLDAWKSIDHRVLRALRLELESFDLRAIEELGLGSVPPGKVEALIAIDSGLKSGRVRVDLVGLKPSPDLAPIDLALRGRLGSESQTVTATVSSGGGEILALRADLRAGLEALALGRAKDPELRVAAAMKKVPIDRIVKRAVLNRALSGRINLELLAGGKLSAPTASVAFALEDAKIGGTSFEVLRGRALGGVKGFEAEISIGSDRGGALELKAKKEGTSPLLANVRAQKFQLGFIGGITRSLGSAAVGLNGALDGTADLSVEKESIAMDGGLAIDGLRLILPGAPRLENGRLAIDLLRDSLKLTVRGDLGRGPLEVDIGVRAPTFSEIDVDGLIALHGVRVDAKGTVVSVDSEVTLSAKKRGADTKAEVKIGPTEITLPAEKGRALYGLEEFEDLEFVENIGERRIPRPPRSPSADGAKVSAKIHTTEPIVARGGENALEISVNLDFNSVGAKQKLTGAVEIEQGRLTIVGKPYTFRRGLVTFDGSFPPSPKLDLRLQHEFQSGLTLLVLVGGTGKKPEIRFASEPGGFDQATLLGYFLGAGPGESGGEGDAGDSAKRAASGFLVSQLADSAKGQVPIDTLDVDLGDGANRAGSISAGKWVTDDLFVGYKYKIGGTKDDESRSEGLLRWRFARGWTVEARFGDKADGGVDAVWSHRFK